MLGLGLGTSKGGFVDALAEVTNTKSIIFDGGDEFISIADNANLGGMSELSISFWIKIDGDNISTGDVIIDKGHSDTYQIKINSSNRLQIFVNGDNMSSNNDSVLHNIWNHIVFTYDSSGSGEGKIYVNGSLDKTDSSFSGSAIGDNSNVLKIGNHQTSSKFYVGNIDEVAIWNDVLTATEVAQIYNTNKANLDLSTDTGNYSSSANLKMWLRMGDEASTRVVDDNANNLVIPDMRKTFFTGKSIDFDGSDDFIDCGDVSFMNNASALSISFWARVNQLGVIQNFFSKDAGDNIDQFNMRIASNNKLFMEIERDNSYASAFTSSVILSDTNWHHYVIIFDGSQSASTDKISLYVDSQSQTTSASGTIATTLADLSGVSLLIGKRRTIEYGGKICDFAIWNTVLDANTVASIYNSGEPNNLLLSASYTAGSGVDKTANLQAYYRMGNGTLDLDSSSGSSNSALLIADQTNATLGSELITDPTFSLSGTQSASTTGTYWETGADWSIGSGVATHDGSGTSNLKALAIIDDDGIYKISLTVGGTSTPEVKCQIGSTSDHSGNLGVGTHTFILKSSNAHDDLIIRHVGGAPTIDDVSCKKIQGNAGVMENMSAFDIVDHAPNRNSGDMINFDATSDIETDTP